MKKNACLLLFYRLGQRRTFLFILLSGLLFSCNPDEEVPSYIRIEKIGFSVDSSLVQGSSSSKITDAWVYVDEKLVGVFELPVTFPVLFEGQHRVKVRAGIKVNGIAATRGAYPFYSNWEQTVNLGKGNIIDLYPSVKYLAMADFPWQEDFELPGIKFTPHVSSDTIIQPTSVSGEVFEGSQSGKVVLDGNKTFFEAISSTKISLPKGGAPVYLEMNYKSNTVFAVGIYSYSPGQTDQLASIIINPVEYWNKIYINLTDVVSAQINAGSYSIFVGFRKEPEVNTPTLYLDNLKLIY